MTAFRRSCGRGLFDYPSSTRLSVRPLVRTILSLGFGTLALIIKSRSTASARLAKQTQTGRRYQVHFLPASLCYAVDNNHHQDGDTLCYACAILILVWLEVSWPVIVGHGAVNHCGTTAWCWCSITPLDWSRLERKPWNCDRNGSDSRMKLREKTKTLHWERKHVAWLCRRILTVHWTGKITIILRNCLAG